MQWICHQENVRHLNTKFQRQLKDHRKLLLRSFIIHHAVLDLRLQVLSGQRRVCFEVEGVMRDLYAAPTAEW